MLLSLCGFSIKLQACPLSDRKQIALRWKKSKAGFYSRDRGSHTIFSALPQFDNYRYTLVWLNPLFFIVKVDECNSLDCVTNDGLLMYNYYSEMSTIVVRCKLQFYLYSQCRLLHAFHLHSSWSNKGSLYSITAFW